MSPNEIDWKCAQSMDDQESHSHHIDKSLFTSQSLIKIRLES